MVSLRHSTEERVLNKVLCMQNALRHFSVYASEMEVDAYVVGGYVRDTVRGAIPNDIDISVVNHYAIAQNFADYLEKRGMLVGVHRDEKIVRVTLKDTRQKIAMDFAEMVDGNIYHDLAKRDFSCNAMAIPVDRAGEADISKYILDPYLGKVAIRNGLVTAVHANVFHADPVRCMRAIRLAVGMDMSIEHSTKMLIDRDVSLLKTAAPERIRMELMSMLETPKAAKAARQLKYRNILDIIMPELVACKGISQPPQFHQYDVFNHCVETLSWASKVVDGNSGYMKLQYLFPDGHFGEIISEGYTLGAHLKLAALLHDIGKATTRSVDADGIIRFHGHDDAGVELAHTLMKRLRFSSKSIHIVTTMIREHMRTHHLCRMKTPTRRAVRRYQKATNPVTLATLALGASDLLGGRGVMLQREEWNMYCDRLHLIGEEVDEQIKPKERLITGHDLMQMGMKPCPGMGRVLAKIEDAHATREISTRAEALNMARKEIASIL